MSSLTFLALLTAAVAGTDAENYAEAHHATIKTGRPMLVMVSTDWCAPCQMMKKTILPEVKRHGLLSRVAFTVVNPDHDHELAEQLIGSGPVPQLLMFRKTREGWRRWQLVGGQSVETVEEFINQGVVTDTKSKKETSKKDSDKDREHDTAKKASVDTEKHPNA